MNRNITFLYLFLSSFFVYIMTAHASAQPHNIKNFNPDAEFTVFTVGTGCPIFSKNRVKPSTVIQYSGNYIIIDSGDGSFNEIEKYGLPQKKITGIFYTHHHLDHNADAIPLFLNSRLRGSNAVIVGPSEPSTKELVDFILKFYKFDISYRCLRTGMSYEKFCDVKIKEISKPTEFNIGKMKISATNVVHTIPAYAYRFDYAGKSIVISGDTSYSENLIKLSKNADILVMDSGGIKYKNSGKKMKQQERKPFRDKSAKNQNSIDDSVSEYIHRRPHASMKEVALMAEKANVKTLILTHFRPGQIDTEETLKGIGKYYHGKVIFASDMKQYTP